MRRAFGQPGFPALFAGISTSALGDSIMLLVLSMWVKTLTGSNSAAGLTFLFMMLPTLLAPLFGVWIDRIRRKPMIVGANLASAGALLPLLLVRDAGQMWIIWIVAFLYGVSFIVIPAALNGLLKELLADDVLVDANAALQTTRESFRLFGPLVGAALFGGFGPTPVIWVDIASFVVGAVLVAKVAVREDQPSDAEGHAWHEMTAGVRFLGTDAVLKHVLIGFGMMLLVLGFTESSLYAILDDFGKPATFAGLVVTIQSLGAVAGGLLSNTVVRRLGEAGATAAGMAWLGLCLALMTMSHSLVLLLAATAVLGFSIPIIFVAFTTLQQRRTPQSVMGRVSMATEVVMGVPQAVSLAVGALLVAILSWRSIFLGIAAMTIAGAAYIAVALREHIRAEMGQVPEGALTGRQPG
jgi:MFS family permease